MVITCAASRAGSSKGCNEWVTSKRRPASASAGDQPNRYHDRFSSRTGEIGGACKSILPRAREERQIERSSDRAQQRLDELVRVLAYAAPFPQRGSVINQDAHL